MRRRLKAPLVLSLLLAVLVCGSSAVFARARKPMDDSGLNVTTRMRILMCIRLAVLFVGQESSARFTSASSATSLYSSFSLSEEIQSAH